MNRMNVEQFATPVDVRFEIISMFKNAGIGLINVFDEAKVIDFIDECLGLIRLVGNLEEHDKLLYLIAFYHGIAKGGHCGNY